MNKRLQKAIHEGEAGQSAWFIILSLLAVFAVFAITFDAGVWYFDHREAQNQSEAAVLAGIQHMPVATGDASGQAEVAAAVDQWLARNRSSSLERSCLQFEDQNGDGKYETLRVCVRRESPSFFAKLGGVDFTRVSAAAAAKVGKVTIGRVMPWAVVPPDITCQPDEQCETDPDWDGTPDETCDFVTCPWGITDDQLIAFMRPSGGDGEPGNFGAILACEGPNVYEDCIEGTAPASGFFEEGENVETGSDPGSNAKSTYDGLEARYASESDHAACDVPVHPDPETGVDAAARAAAYQKYVVDGICSFRLVLVPIIERFPNGSSDTLQVLGVATFAIIGWDRSGPHNNAEGNLDTSCEGPLGNTTPKYPCGAVWGFFMRDAIPPGFLLEQIDDDSNNPFAPLLIALVE